MSSCFKVFIKVFFSFLCFFLLIFYPALLCAKSKNIGTESANIDLTYQTLPHRQNLAIQDIFDIDSMMSAQATSLLSKKFVQKLQSKKIIAISDIENTTQESIDIESMMIGFKQSVVEKFVFTNAIASNANKADKLIKDSRTLRNNAEYNQYTTKEEGGLLAPDYSLSGKISKRAKSIGKEVRLEYAILLRLTDLATGVEVWSNIAKSTKILPKNVAQKYLQESKNQKSTTTPNTPKTTMSNSEWEKAYKKCLSEDFGACQRLVDNGLANVEQCDKKSCNKIGTILRNIGHLDEAVEYYKRAISLGDYEGYSYLSQVYYERYDNITEAKAQLKQSCDKVDYLDCIFLGGLHSSQKDFANAKKYFEITAKQANNEIKALAYGVLAVLYFDGNGVPKNISKAISYLKKSCDLKFAESCFWVGEIYAEGKEITQNLELSKQYFRKSCDLDYQKGCEVYDDFIKNEKKQGEFDESFFDCVYDEDLPACQKLIDLGMASLEDCNYTNCFLTGSVYYVAGHLNKAILYYQKAISLGDEIGYSGLGNVFYKKQDFHNAKKNFEIACNKLNNVIGADSCHNLGLLYQNGEGVRQDYNRAFEYYKKSCELKSPAGAIIWAWLMILGRA